MQIARVEPLTTARALRGPFDYRLPEAMSDVGVGSLLEVPFGPRRILGVVVDLAAETDVPPDRLAEPIAALEAGATPELVRLGLWVAERYCSTPARGLALVLPPGSGTGARGRAAVLRPRTERWAAITEAGRAAIGPDVRRPAPRASGSAPRSSCWRPAASGARRRWPRPAPTRASSPGWRLAACSSASEREVRRRPVIARRRRGAGGRPPLGRTARLRRRRDRLDRGRRAPASGCSTASPGRARPRSTWRRPRRRSERGRGAILLVPEIGLTPQTLGRVAARLGDTRGGAPLRPLRRRAPRRVAAAALGRGPGLRRPPLGGLRAGGGPRPDRRRRGARPLLQAGGRPPLRRPRRGPPPRRDRRGRLPGRDRDAAAGELGGARPPRAPRQGRRAPAASGRGARHARCAAPWRTPAPGGARGARRPGRRRQGDRDAEPPRLRAAPVVLGLRRRGELPGLRRQPGAEEGRGATG